MKKNIVGVSWHQEFYQGNKRTRVLYKAFAPSGRRAKCDDTQGDALGYELLPLQGRGVSILHFLPVYQSLAHIIQLHSKNHYIPLIRLEWLDILI